MSDDGTHNVAALFRQIDEQRFEEMRSEARASERAAVLRAVYEEIEAMRIAWGQIDNVCKCLCARLEARLGKGE